ncbi:MAG: molybdopterin-dependent oxidoreductase [Bacteroidales bacterium]|nr:molybdopterin-dependent oxidoreductase [Bacteroidales bacterium]
MRANDFSNDLGITASPDWKPVLFDESSSDIAVPNGTIGSRWDKSQQWNLEQRRSVVDEIRPKLSMLDNHDETADVAFPYFGGETYKHGHFNSTDDQDILYRKIPIKKADGKKVDFTHCTVFDLLVANYGVDRGLEDESAAQSYDDEKPYTPAWQEKITGVPRNQVISTARQFADTAVKTEGKSMIIIGAGVNHWFHTDMIYRSAINLLVLCGTVGKSGGGWAHYVGQEKLRPQTGWLPLAFALDWNRPPRHMNTTSFFYMHTDQWRYQKSRTFRTYFPAC